MEKINLKKIDFKIMQPEPFFKIVQPLAKKIFDDSAQIADLSFFQSKQEKKNNSDLALATKAKYRLHVGVYYGKKLIGWHWGWQDETRYYMTNSAILPKYRKNGIYTELMKFVIAEVQRNKFSVIYSRHVMTNNPILVSKLKFGFKITSFELNDRFGATVHLTYYLNKQRSELLDYRSGFIRPTARVKKSLKL